MPAAGPPSDARGGHAPGTAPASGGPRRPGAGSLLPDAIATVSVHPRATQRSTCALRDERVAPEVPAASLSAPLARARRRDGYTGPGGHPAVSNPTDVGTSPPKPHGPTPAGPRADRADRAEACVTWPKRARYTRSADTSVTPTTNTTAAVRRIGGEARDLSPACQRTCTPERTTDEVRTFVGSATGEHRLQREPSGRGRQTHPNTNNHPRDGRGQFTQRCRYSPRAGRTIEVWFVWIRSP